MFQFCFIGPADGVNISVGEAMVQASHPITFTIQDLQDGSEFKIQVEGNTTVPRGESYSVDIINLTLPFSLRSATFTGYLEGSTNSTITVQKGEYQITRTGGGYETSVIPFPVNGTFDHILLQGTSTTGRVYMVPQISGIKTGPDDSQVSLAVEGIEGDIKVKIFVNDELAFDQAIVVTPTPPPTTPGEVVASIALGTAVGLAGAAAAASASSASGSAFALASKGFFGFLKGFGSEAAEDKFGEFETKRLPAFARVLSKVSYEFVGFEAIVGILGGFLFGLATILSLKAPFSFENIIIFAIAAGIAIVGHELAHWYLGRRKKTDTDIHFWGLGTIIMFITAWLFGNVFGQPCRTTIDNIDTLEPRESAEIMLAGPLVSIALAAISIPLVFAGGKLMLLGQISILMNLALATYHMMPFSPMDGQIVYKWNKIVWALVFIPVIVAYVLMFYFGLASTIGGGIVL